MKHVFLRFLPVVVALASVSAHAQFYKLHGATIAVGATGPFDTELTSNARSGNYQINEPGGGVINQTVSNQQQFTTNSVGLVTSFQFHPKPWAGVEVNYGYRTYTEIYQFNYSGTPATQESRVRTSSHEATAAYEFHPKHIPFQPFVNVGGGAIDFLPRFGQNQWRGAGLLETGFDIPTHNPHFGFRVEGRGLFYRAPNYNTPAISTGSWRATEEASVGTFYRF